MTLHDFLKNIDTVLAGKYVGRGFTVYNEGLKNSDLKVEDGGARPTDAEIATILAS